MNVAPSQINLEEIRDLLADLPGIVGVHHLHVRRISSSSIGFTCHVVVPDQPVSGTEEIGLSISHALQDRFRIDHPVLQFETTPCDQGKLLCELSA